MNFARMHKKKQDYSISKLKKLNINLIDLITNKKPPLKADIKHAKQLKCQNIIIITKFA